MLVRHPGKLVTQRQLLQEVFADAPSVLRAIAEEGGAARTVELNYRGRAFETHICPRAGGGFLVGTDVTDEQEITSRVRRGQVATVYLRGMNRDAGTKYLSNGATSLGWGPQGLGLGLSICRSNRLAASLFCVFTYIAPTLLGVLGQKQPADMTGTDLRVLT